MNIFDRPIFYFKGGRPTYRASAIGYCLRVLTAARMGYAPLEQSDQLALAAREGHRHEDWVVADLEAEGWEITGRGKEIYLPFPAFAIEGHIDGLASWGRETFLLEIKSMSRFQFRKFTRQGLVSFPGYARQIAVYHRAIELPILYAVKCRDTGEMKLFELERPPVKFSEVYDRILTAELFGRKGVLAEPECEPGSIEEKLCRYRYLCEGRG